MYFIHNTIKINNNSTKLKITLDLFFIFFIFLELLSITFIAYDRNL